jgi:hypothetical protein
MEIVRSNKEACGILVEKYELRCVMNRLHGITARAKNLI